MEAEIMWIESYAPAPLRLGNIQPGRLWPGTPPQPPIPARLWRQTATGVLRPPRGVSLFVCLSCCPQDITRINSQRPRSAHSEVLGR